jgi:hypothetical protein
MTRKRPASLTVFGILNLVFGGLFLLCFGCGLALAPAMQKFQANQGQKTGLDQQALQKHLDDTVPGYTVFRWVAMGFSLALPALLIGAGIALLRMSAAAKSLCIVWSLVTILYLLGSLIYQIAIVNAPSAEFVKQQKVELPGFVTDPNFYTVAGIIGTAFFMIYPIILLVFAMLPSTGKALAGGRGDEYGGGVGDDYYDPDFERRRREPPPQS